MKENFHNANGAISIGEFQSICKKLSPSHILFSSSNQASATKKQPVRFSYEFNNIDVCFDLKTIKLTSNNGTITFERIEYVIHNTKMFIGDVFTVVCQEDPYSGSDTICYTIIMS